MNRGSTFLFAGVLLVLTLVHADRSMAAMFFVNSSEDRVDSSVGNGSCRAGNGRCTLRAAIQEANASAAPDTIVLGRAVYELALAPGSGGIAGGDLDITSPLTITGEGATRTILDGGRPPSGSPPEVRGLDRLLEVHASAGDVTLSALTLREGYSAQPGGGIANASLGTLRLTGVTVSGSYSAMHGGGLHNAGSGVVELTGSTLTGNGAKKAGSALNNEAAGRVRIGPGSSVVNHPGSYPIGGAAILNSGADGAKGSVEVVQATISDNLSRADGAGIANEGAGSVLVDRSTLTRNVTEGNGGAIHNASGSVTVTGIFPGLLGSTISNNSARTGGGIYNAGRLSADLQRPRIEVARSTISGNTAEGLGGGGGGGGGVFNDLDGDLTLTDVIVSGNTAAAEGGGVSTQHKSSTTVVGGTVFGNRSGDGGGGISAFAEGPLTVKRTLFTGNHAGGADGGGGLYTDGPGDVTITDATFAVNSTAGDGGAAAIDSFGAVTVSDTVLRNNSAAGRGGGLADQGTLVTLTRLTVAGNAAGDDGGGIDNKARGTLDLIDSTIEGNTGRNGGGLANAADAVMTVSRSRFTRNLARESGGGVHNDSDAALAIEESTISENTARASGGAVHSTTDAPFAIVASTLSSNNASAYGGALYNDSDAEVEVVNSTVSGNSAKLAGGAVFSDANGSLAVVNATVAGNAAPLGASFSHRDGLAAELLTLRNTIVTAAAGNCSGAVGSEGGNLENGVTCGLSGPGDRSDVDPALEPLGDNGGSTLTHALRSGSPAIDGGITPCPASDQRGVGRPLGARCDTGAFEAEPPPADVTPPETSITGGPGSADDGEASFSFAGTDDRTGPLSFQCRLDGSEWHDCSSPSAYSNLDEGAHTFEVRAVDAAGNADPEPAARTWTSAAGPDTSAPAVTLGDAPLDPADAVNARFTFAGTDDRTPEGDLAFECRLDDSEWASCSSPVTYERLTVGSHAFAVRAIDAAGNTGTPVTFEWTILADSAAPDATIGDGPAGETDAIDARLTFSASDDRSAPSALTFECRLDAGDWAACASPASYGGLSDGEHVFAVRASDEAGNTGTAVTRAWTVLPDTIAPTTTLGDRPGDGSSPTARFTFAGSDNRTSESSLRFQCRIDSAAWTACTSPASYSDLGPGSHTFEVRALDEAGNSGAPAMHAWTISAPAICPEQLVAPAEADSWIDQNSGFTNKGTDSILKLQSKGPADNYRLVVRFGLDFEALPAGCAVASATLRMYAASLTTGRRLEALRLDSPWSEEVVAWRSQPLTTGAAAVTTSDSGYRSWNVTSHVRAVQAGAANHGFLIRDAAEDGLGEAQSFHSREKGDNPPELVMTFAPAASPDGVAPETTIESGPGSSGPSAKFTFSADVGDATFECSLDGEPFAECSSPVGYDGLALGPHALRVRARDAGGDVDGSPATRTWTVASSCAPATVTATADADAWVLQSAPGDNKGEDSVLKVDSKAGGNSRVLIRFDLPARPPDCEVKNATLRLYSGSFKAGRTLQALRLDGSWTEDGVTWGSQPSTTGSPAEAQSPSAPGYVEWSATSFVNAFYAGSNDGVLIRDAAEDDNGLDQTFHSREKADDNPPQLVIAYG